MTFHLVPTVLATSLVLAAPAQALGILQCTVDQFLTTDDDPGFVQKNLMGFYQINHQPKSVRVLMRSDVFEPTNDVFTVQKSSGIDTVAIRNTYMMHSVIVVPVNPDSEIDSKGSVGVTIALMGNAFANTWLLDCTR